MRILGKFEGESPPKEKGRPLGERPAFLTSPPGCGVIEAFGCVGRGLRWAAWEAAGGLSESRWFAARLAGAARSQL